jgi:hypothetical protein
MVKHDDEEWTLPRRKPITKEVLDRAIRAEEDAAARDDGPLVPDGHVPAGASNE